MVQLTRNIKRLLIYQLTGCEINNERHAAVQKGQNQTFLKCKKNKNQTFLKCDGTNTSQALETELDPSTETRATKMKLDKMRAPKRDQIVTSNQNRCIIPVEISSKYSINYFK